MILIVLAKDEAMKRLEEWHRATESTSACAMCRLAHPSQSHQRVAESEHGVVVLSGFAATEGHLLVIARSHVEQVSDIAWPVYNDLQRLVWEATRTVEAVLGPERVYTAAFGSSAKLSMSFPHYHVHVAPVYATDERARPAHVFSWSSGVLSYDQGDAEAMVHRLRKNWCESGASARAAAHPSAAPVPGE